MTISNTGFPYLLLMTVLPLAGALVVGLMRAAAISLIPELEMLSVYLVVVLVLIVRPAGLFGKASA